MARPNFRRSFRQPVQRDRRSPFCAVGRRCLGIDQPSLQKCDMTQETIARLRISLDGIEPEIWRTVEMPVTGSLKMLHDVIQAAMGWQDYHLWHFEAGNRRYGVDDFVVERERGAVHASSKGNIPTSRYCDAFAACARAIRPLVRSKQALH